MYFFFSSHFSLSLTYVCRQTSVLMNPRETLFDNWMDEFAAEQSAVLDVLHPSGPSASDVAECRRVTARLRALLEHRSRGGLLVPQAVAAARDDTTPDMYLLSRFSGDTEDVEVCFREVPPVFFRPHYAPTSAGSHDLLHQHQHQHSYLKAEELNEMIESVASGAGGSGGAEFQPHLERLSQYLDLVELALLKQIWAKSPAFFRASDDIRGLREAVKNAIYTLSARRRDLRNVADGLRAGPMWIPQVHRRAENQKKLLSKLSAVQRVLRGRAAVTSLMEIEDHLGALQVTAETLEVYRQECEGIAALRDIGDQLIACEDAIAQSMCSSFTTMAMDWSDFASSAAAEGGTVGGRHDTEAEAVVAASLAPLGSLIKALFVVNKLDAALQQYTSRLLECVKVVVRSCVSEYLVLMDTSFDLSATLMYLDPGKAHSSSLASASNDLADNDSPFSVRVKEMSNESFFSCISMCFDQLADRLRAACRVNEYLAATLVQTYGLEVTDSVLDRTRSIDILRNINVSGAALKSASDAAQRYVSQFLVLRRDACVAMSTDQIRRLWREVSDFIALLEKLLADARRSVSISTGGSAHGVLDGGAADETLASLAAAPTSALMETPQAQQLQSASTYTLRKTLIGIAKGFLERYHDSNKAKLVATVDAEKWAQCEVSAHRQACIDVLTSGKIVLFASASQKGPGSLDIDEAKYAGMPSNAFVAIDSQTFKVAWSSLQLVEMLLSYLGLAAAFRGKVVEDSIIPKISELLQLFDKHSKRLVLGAQAMKSAAQLKSISARHLAVTMQSVSLLSALIPHIRAALLGHLTSSSSSTASGGGASSLLVELDRISNDYMEHTSALLSKFVHIVGDAVDASQPKLSKTDWDRFHGHCEYFDDLGKNIAALHRVLVSILPPEVLQSVFTRIFMFLNRKIGAHFEDVMPATQTGRQRIVDEVSHLVVSFQQLASVSAAAAMPIEEAFRKKYEAAKM